MRTLDGFKKGVNLGGWLSQGPLDKEHLDTFITEKDIARVEKYQKCLNWDSSQLYWNWYAMDYASSYERVDPWWVEICSLADNIIGNPDNFMVFVFQKNG